MLKQVKLIENQAGFDGGDILNWSVIDNQSELSPEFPPPFPEFGNHICLASEAGIKVNVGVPQGNLVRINQNDFFPGTFEIGDNLLFTGFGNPGPLTLEFNHSLSKFGVSIQSDPQVPSDTPPPYPFTVYVEAFNFQAESLGTFELYGFSKIEAASGTTFIGLINEQSEIAKVAIEVIEQGASIPFAINMLKLQTDRKLIPEKEFESIRESIQHFN